MSGTVVFGWCVAMPAALVLLVSLFAWWRNVIAPHLIVRYRRRHRTRGAQRDAVLDEMFRRARPGLRRDRVEAARQREMAELVDALARRRR
jgi:hypothetical protein